MMKMKMLRSHKLLIQICSCKIRLKMSKLQELVKTTFKKKSNFLGKYIQTFLVKITHKHYLVISIDRFPLQKMQLTIKNLDFKPMNQ